MLGSRRSADEFELPLGRWRMATGRVAVSGGDDPTARCRHPRHRDAVGGLQRGGIRQLLAAA
jgi:hypothetical protein